VAAVTPSAFGFDVDFPLTASEAGALKAQYGYSFCVRYLPHPPYIGASDLSAAETAAILSVGLPLMAVQHTRKPPWAPNGTIGTQDGQWAAAHAANASLPAGVSVFCDLEGVDLAVPAADVTAYCNNWFDAVAASGFLPGLYIGFDCILDQAQLSALNYQAFWKSCSTAPVPAAGFSMVQVACDVMRGNPAVNVDENQIAAQPLSMAWLAPA
jgi:hypothetical protein